MAPYLNRRKKNEGTKPSEQTVFTRTTAQLNNVPDGSRPSLLSREAWMPAHLFMSPHLWVRNYRAIAGCTGRAGVRGWPAGRNSSAADSPVERGVSGRRCCPKLKSPYSSCLVVYDVTRFPASWIELVHIYPSTRSQSKKKTFRKM